MMRPLNARQCVPRPVYTIPYIQKYRRMNVPHPIAYSEDPAPALVKGFRKFSDTKIFKVRLKYHGLELGY